MLDEHQAARRRDAEILHNSFQQGGPFKGKFLFFLYKNDPKTMSDVLYRATKNMNAEDALLAREENPKKRERQEDMRQDRGRKIAKTGDRQDERRFRPPNGNTFVPPKPMKGAFFGVNRSLSILICWNAG